MPKNYREEFPPNTNPELKKLVGTVHLPGIWFVDYLEKMWAPDPIDRPVMTEVLDTLWGLKDSKGHRYAGRYELMTDALWCHLAKNLDSKSKLALAISSKALGKTFDSLLSRKKVSPFAVFRS